MCRRRLKRIVKGRGIGSRFILWFALTIFQLESSKVLVSFSAK